MSEILFHKLEVNNPIITRKINVILSYYVMNAQFFLLFFDPNLFIVFFYKQNNNKKSDLQDFSQSVH